MKDRKFSSDKVNTGSIQTVKSSKEDYKMKDVKIWSSREITGSIQVRRTTRGKEYLYMVFNTYDENGKFSQKWQSTGLLKDGNKKKAEKMLSETLLRLNHELEALEKEKEEAMVNPLVVECLDTYLEKAERQIEKNTFQSYRRRGKHIKSYFEGKRIQDIGTKEVNEFCKYLLSEGKVNKRTGARSPLSNSTVRDIKMILGQVLDEAKVNGYVKENPAKEVRISRKTKGKTARKFRAMDMGRIEESFRFLESTDDPLTDMVKTALYYGLRRSEVMAISLNKDSLDMENRILHIRNTYISIEDEGAMLKDATKSEDGTRNYELSDDMYEFFESIIRKKEENKKFFGNTYHDSEFLFTWADGVPFRHDYVSKHFEKKMAEFGNPDFTLHNLRHSCATFLYKEGLDQWELGSWMGHADPSTTKKWYADIERYANNMTAKKIAHKVKIMAPDLEKIS